MKKLFIIQNDPEVPPGNLLQNISAEYSLCHPYLGEQLPPLAEISALIVLGGSMSANDDHQHHFLAALKTVISNVVSEEIPYLGICLGGQLLAAATGGLVVQNRWEEIGVHKVDLNYDAFSDMLFQGVEPCFNSFQWHHDSFDMPACAVHLASSEYCPNQAFRIGKNAYGLQFHPEVDEHIIRTWCAWDVVHHAQSSEIVDKFKNIQLEYEKTAGQLTRNFMGIIQKK